MSINKHGYRMKGLEAAAKENKLHHVRIFYNSNTNEVKAVKTTPVVLSVLGIENTVKDDDTLYKKLALSTEWFNVGEMYGHSAQYIADVIASMMDDLKERTIHHD